MGYIGQCGPFWPAGCTAPAHNQSPILTTLPLLLLQALGASRPDELTEAKAEATRWADYSDASLVLPTFSLQPYECGRIWNSNPSSVCPVMPPLACRSVAHPGTSPSFTAYIPIIELRRHLVALIFGSPLPSPPPLPPSPLIRLRRHLAALFFGMPAEDLHWTLMSSPPSSPPPPHQVAATFGRTLLWDARGPAMDPHEQPQPAAVTGFAAT